MISTTASLRALSIALPLVALGVNACVGDDPTTTGNPGDGDASTSGDGTTSDGAPPGPCNLAADFGAPTPVAGLQNIGTVARFSQDELTAYFSENVADTGVPHLVQAKRSSMSAAFGTPVPFPELVLTGAGGGEIHPSVTADGLTIYFCADAWDGGVGTDDIVSAHRSAIDASFNAPQVVPGINSAASEEEPYVAASGDLWFTSTRDNVDAGVSQLYRASNVGGSLGAPSGVAEVNSVTDTDQYPVVTNDGLTLYFSRRGPDTNLLDVWTASRTQASGPFSAPAAVASVNSGDDDRSSFVSADRCRLYVTRGAGSGYTFSVYVASKPAN